MIVRKLADIINTDKEVKAETWASRRLLLKDDNMGFSFHDTIIYAGTETHIWYKNHLEAVYCVGGRGEIETLSDGKVYPIERSEEHTSELQSRGHLVCRLLLEKKKKAH